MSDFTDYGENKLADFARGEPLGEPASWWLQLLVTDSESSVEELTGIGLDRVEVVSSLTAWAGTQGPGTTLASFGTSHATSNNSSIPLGTATGIGTADGIGLFDAESGGNCWMVWRFESPLVIAVDDTPVVNAGVISWSLGLSGGMTDYLANVLIDKMFRAQAYSWPASTYWAGFTSAPNNAGGGSEIGGGHGYARVAVPSDLSSWSSTQNTVGEISTGEGGLIRNMIAVTFPQPTGNQGTWSHGGAYDASTAGNLLFWGALAAQRTVTEASNPPKWDIGDLSITFA
jgi:hypothetical protein